MYSPRSLEIESLFTQQSVTAGAEAYRRRLLELSKQLESALKDAHLARPRAMRSVPATSQASDAFWAEEARYLGRVVYLQRRSYLYPAIAPYDAMHQATRASIRVFDPADPSESTRLVFHDPEMAIFDMNLSMDGRRVLFSGNGKIWEIGLDGTGLRQITHGDGIDISPVELPDGEIAFISTRKGSYVHCQSRQAGLLYKVDADGGNLRLLSANQDSDHTPQLMPDGRLLFTRWDYGIEKGVFDRQALWTPNADGTGLQL